MIGLTLKAYGYKFATKPEFKSIERLTRVLQFVFDDDLIGTLAGASGWMSETICKKSDPPDEKDPARDDCMLKFGFVIEFLTTFSTLPSHESAASAAEIEADRAARSELLNSFINSVTNRTGRSNEAIVGLWGGVSFGFNANFTNAGYQPLRVPFGIAFQYPFGLEKPLLHLSFAPLDLGHYIELENEDANSVNETLVVEEPDLTAAFRPSASLGLLWSYDVPVYLALEFLWDPGETSWGGVDGGLSIGFSVPIWDLN